MAKPSKQKVESAVDRMGALKFFPTDRVARAQIGLILAQLCQDDSEVDALLQEVIEAYNEYPGPASLREIYRVKVRKSGESDWVKYPPLPPPKCQKCNDIGAVSVVGTTRWDACDCPASDSGYAIDMTRLHESIASKNKKLPPEITRVLTGKDRAMREWPK